jgi:hypothetical protein
LRGSGEAPSDAVDGRNFFFFSFGDPNQAPGDYNRMLEEEKEFRRFIGWRIGIFHDGDWTPYVACD